MDMIEMWTGVIYIFDVSFVLHTSNETIHMVFRNLCCYFNTVSGHIYLFTHKVENKIVIYIFITHQKRKTILILILISLVAGGKKKSL